MKTGIGRQLRLHGLNGAEKPVGILCTAQSRLP
jgi:hypothetical protein